MSQVIACPNCDKKLALKDGLKGRALICPHCKGRFTVPDDGPQTADPFGTNAGKAPSAGGSDMAFLDELTSRPGPVAAKSPTKTAAGSRPAAATRPAATQPPAPAGSRAAASRAKKQNEQMMMFIGGGIAAALLVVVLVVALSSGGGGRKKNANIRFGLPDSNRHQLFMKMITAVDEYGISTACKEEWLRLADEYKLDRRNLGDLLDEGFDRKDWDQPAPAHVTNQGRATRMEWIAKRHQGRDPILAL